MSALKGSPSPAKMSRMSWWSRIVVVLALAACTDPPARPPELATAEVVESAVVEDVPELACFDHGGGLNACGCHGGKKGCHCHRPGGCGCACEPASCSR